MSSGWRAVSPAPTSVVARYRYVASDRGQVAFNYSDELEVTHESSGWYRGRSLVTRQPGVFPANHCSDGEGADVEDPTLHEINQTVHQWGVLLSQYMRERALESFEILKCKLTEILELRRAVMGSEVGGVERKVAQTAAVDLITRATRQLGLDVIVRHHTSHVASVINTGAFSLLNMHVEQVGLVGDKKQAQRASQAEISSPAASAKAKIRQSDLRPITSVCFGGRVQRNSAGNVVLQGGGGAGVVNLVKQGASLNQLWVQLFMVLADVGSEFELRLALFNKFKGQYLTEEWVVSYDTESNPVGRAKGDPNALSCLMKDIEGTELFNAAAELWLVVKLIRRGGLSQPQESGRGGSRQQQQTRPDFPLRRPFAAGVVKFDAQRALEGDFECRIDLYSCGDQTFAQLPELLISGGPQLDAADIKLSPRCKGIVLKTRLWACALPDLMASGAWAALKTSDFVSLLKVPELVMPGTVRNDFYVTLDDGDFPEKQVEVTCHVRRSDSSGTGFGDIPVPGALSSGASGSVCDILRSLVLAGSSPRWKETFCVRLIEPAFMNYPDVSVLFEFRHYQSSADGNSRPPKPFGFAVLPLFQHGVIIKGDKQRLPVFKWDEIAASTYSLTRGESPRLKELSKSHLALSLRVSSTVHSQNDHLIRLFHWMEDPANAAPGAVSDMLKKLTFVNSDEIVRHLEQVFTALFSMLESEGLRDADTNAVYDAILYTIAKLTESRSVWNFRPVLDTYFSTRYHGAGQHVPLLCCLSESLSSWATPQGLQAATRSLKVLDYIFVITAQSRLNAGPSDGGRASAESFRDNLARFLDSLSKLMTSESKTLIAAQNSAFKHFPSVVRQLLRFFAAEEICDVITDFLKVSDHLTGLAKINTTKLGLYRELATGELFDTETTRAKLIPVMVSFLRRHLERVVADMDAGVARGGAETAAAILASPGTPEGKPEDAEQKALEGYRCAEVFGIFVDILQIRCGLEERQKYVMLLLPTLPTMVVFHNHLRRLGNGGGGVDPEIIREELGTLTVVVSLLHAVTPDSWEHHLSSLPDEIERVRLCTLLCAYLADSVPSAASEGQPRAQRPVANFPSSWGTMIGLHCSTLLKMAYVLESSSFLRRRLLQFSGDGGSPSLCSEEDDVALLRAFLSLCTRFTKSPGLRLSAVTLLTLERFGDMRAPMSGILRRVWKMVPKRHGKFPEMVADLIDVMNVDQRAANTNALEAYFNTIQSEFSATGDIVAIKGLTVDAFDKGKFRESFADFFFSSLQTRFAGAGPPLADRWTDFSGVQSYIDLICHYEAAVPREPSNADLLVGATLDLLCYLREHERRLPFVKYVHLLAQQHLTMGNHIETALSILLHADLYSWTPAALVNAVDEQAISVPGLCNFPAQPGWAIREKLVDQAMEHMEKGNAFERAISLSEEKSAFLEGVKYDYMSAAKELRNEARLYRKALTEERIPPIYYRVGFFGKGFPEVQANKEFIYKAKPLEKLADFQQRIMEQYPGSTLLRKTDWPPAEVTEANAMSLLITAVSPCGPDGETRELVAPSGEDNVFVYSKAFRKEKQKVDENEFLNLWLSQLYLTTTEKFPRTSTRAEVVSRREVVSRPIEHALKCVRDKNAELEFLIEKTKRRPGESLQPLVMALNGVVLAGVNGGIPKYRDAFLRGAYIKDNPKDGDVAARLKVEIHRQVEIVWRGMALHEERCSSDMRDLHNMLQQKLEESKGDWEGQSPPPSPGSLATRAMHTSGDTP